MQDRVAYLEQDARQMQRQLDANTQGSGELDRRLIHLEGEMNALKRTNEMGDAKLHEAINGLIKEREAEKNFFRGIRSTIVAAVAAAGAVAGAITWIMSHFVK